jgi:hypothetical protein
MARIRTIKPEFWTDGDMLKLSRDARLFYVGLWNFCDDNGVIEHDPVSIKARIFPNDRVSVDKLLKELVEIGKAIIYEVEKKQYIFIKNLANHQVIDRPRKSHLPLPNGNQMKSLEITLGRKEGKEGKGIPYGQLSDEEFLKDLKTNPVYKHINIDTELGKMDVWLSTRSGRKKTRRFIVNWLNKIDRPVDFTPKREATPDPNCDICKGKGKIPDGPQKGGTCLCVKTRTNHPQG